MQESDNTVVISVDREFSGNRMRNFFITTFLLWFLWMLFHFTVIFFFTFRLESIALVWVFLGLANLVSFLIDIPIWVLQKYFKSKTLYLIGAISQLIAMLIFTLFIFQITDQLAKIGEDVEIVWSILSFFLWNFLNIILLLVASICYGITQEINSVTSLSYIMNHVDPSKYAEILARNNIFTGIGMFSGLISSWLIMTFKPKLIIIALILIIAMVIYFTSHFFDNADETIQVSDIKKLKVSFKKPNIENVREYISTNIKKEDLQNIVSKTKYIFLKPKKLAGKIKVKDLFNETISTMKVIIKILSQKPANLTIYWTIITVLTFGFWDTFAATFLVGFLDQVKSWWSYILLWFIAIPAYLLQEPFGKMGRKIGIFPVALVGLILSWASLTLMSFFSEAGPITVMSFALMNSIGYSAGMALGQISFLDNYNKEYARLMDLKEIDANASAWPMKILQNIANVIGLMLGGFILWVLKYRGFFLLFWVGIIAIFIWSIRHKKDINP